MFSLPILGRLTPPLSDLFDCMPSMPSTFRLPSGTLCSQLFCNTDLFSHGIFKFCLHNTGSLFPHNYNLHRCLPAQWFLRWSPSSKAFWFFDSHTSNLQIHFSVFLGTPIILQLSSTSSSLLMLQINFAAPTWSLAVSIVNFPWPFRATIGWLRSTVISTIM